MSYDISLMAKVEGYDKYIDVGNYHNITWNVRELIEKSSGWEIKNMQDNGTAEDLIPKLIRGISELSESPELYKQYEAENGWGTVEHTIPFFKELLEDCVEHPYAHVFIS